MFILYLQKVNLYRDPNGEMIFSDSVATFTKQSTHTNQLTMTTRATRYVTMINDAKIACTIVWLYDIHTLYITKLC